MEKIYCFTLDDNIRFMENACRRKEPSLLQSPYLAMLFRLHKEFGCKFQLNMFYSYYPGSFSLADVPDIYKKELKEMVESKAEKLESIKYAAYLEQKK